MLARSAARSGLRPVVLDLYADTDTRQHAAAWAQVPPGPVGFEPAALLAAAARLASAEQGYALAYGSGLDLAPDLLERLSLGRQVYGNCLEALRLVKSPVAFFGLLDRLGIPYPETRFDPPSDPRGWLVKPGCGEGGKGVGFCAQSGRAGAGGYYQRHLPGPPRSALFLADGVNARLIGFNTLWTASLPGQPFLFAGAVNRTDLSPAQRAEVSAHLARLTQAAGLKGLNCLDFMLDEAGACRVLEINPRPSATLGLYDADFPEGLLARHLRACRGELGAPWQPGVMARAFRVWFADHDFAVPDTLDWPAWCADRPPADTFIRAGEPLCSVEAEGLDRLAAERQLRQRFGELRRLLEAERASRPSVRPDFPAPPPCIGASPSQPLTHA
jgi:predicted ATP-grasp superfamily ATP-dependent carboligase